AHAALEQDDALALPGEIGEQSAVLGVGGDLGSDRDLDDEVAAAGAGPVRPGAALAPRSAEMLGVAEVDERVEAGHRFEHDVAALAPVAAVGPAALDELFAPEADRAGAASAGLHVDFGLVEKMHRGRVRRTFPSWRVWRSKQSAWLGLRAISRRPFIAWIESGSM